MTSLQQLQSYLGQLARRIRLVAALRGTALTMAGSLLLTTTLVWIADRYKFASTVVLPFRILLFSVIFTLITCALALPLKRLTRFRITRMAEQRFPQFGERLLTLTERPDESNPFTELIAEEALQVSREQAIDDLAPSRSIYLFAAAAISAAVALLWTITAAPGFLGYGASLLWTGTPHAGSKPLYEVFVQPGNKTIRRRANQLISAQLSGFSSHNVTLHARYHGSLKWEPIPMQPAGENNGYQVLFPGLSDSLDYFVQADDARSKQFTLGVKDLPAVRHISVNIRFPSGLGLRDIVDSSGGDIRAVVGSHAKVAVEMDHPLKNGFLVFDNGKQIPLTADVGPLLHADLEITHDGSYHIAAIEDGEMVRISDDYFVEARKDEAPMVRIVNPGRDPHVSPIEEVGIAAEATDDFEVDSLELHYSVNGAPEQVRSLKKGTHAKELSGKTTLALEDFKLAPGDLISFYATARDATHTANSDMVFAQADPFDYKFQQSQQAGGGGGGGGDADQSGQISQRQKELIAATWNQLKDGLKDHSVRGENARFLSDMETKLSAQAKALAERMGSRDLSGLSPQFEQFSQSMNAASDAMRTAVEQLRPAKWSDALAPEERALKSLLRAESIFRDIQVSYGKQGGGMGGSGADRDLARMLDLELDTAKNQYETKQSASLPGNDVRKQADDAFQRLKDLARRQQELAQQQKSEQAFEQRWEEEQLRREAEQLRQQLQQLAKQSDSGSSGQKSQSQSGAKGGQSASGGSSEQASSERSEQDNSGSGSAGNMSASSMRRSMESLERAEDEMRKAVSNHDGTAQSRAAAQLAEAQNAMKGMLNSAAGNGVSNLRQEAHNLAKDQKELANRVKQLYGASGINTARLGGAPGEGADGKVEMPEMSIPGEGGGGWWRRRYTPEITRNATPAEKTLAGESEKLAQRMEELQRDMQKESQSLRPEQPDVARKMREALSDAEQQELAMRMQKSGEWLRRGFGQQTWPHQDSIGAGLDQLDRQLQDTEQAMANAKSGSANQHDEKVAQALSEVRSLREQMEANSRARSQAGRGQGQAQAQASDRGSDLQNGASSQKQGKASSGQSSGEGAEAGQGSEQSGAYAQNGGDGHPRIGGGGSDSAIAELQGLRSSMGPGDRQLNKYLTDAIGSLRQESGRAGLLEARINQDAVTSLERLELELTRRLGQSQGGARTGAPETAPDAYRDAVAEYFKRLSK